MSDDSTPQADVSLEKVVWTESDFDVMGWHDATIHAVAFEYRSDKHSGGPGSGGCRVCFDIDYIAAWVDPVPPNQSFSFWVAPATLVFEDVVLFDIEQSAYDGDLVQISDLSRGEPEDEQQRRWMQETGGVPWELDEIGTIWTASGFHQHFRRQPVCMPTQMLELRVRGGISFDQPQDFENSLPTG